MNKKDLQACGGLINGLTLLSWEEGRNGDGGVVYEV